MDEKTFRTMANDVIERVRKALDREDPDVVEGVLEAGVLKIQFPSGAPYVLNLQPPVREVWLAADRLAWHFRYEGEKWIDKKSGQELYALLGELLRKKVNREIVL